MKRIVILTAMILGCACAWSQAPTKMGPISTPSVQTPSGGSSSNCFKTDGSTGACGSGSGTVSSSGLTPGVYPIATGAQQISDGTIDFGVSAPNALNINADDGSGSTDMYMYAAHDIEILGADLVDIGTAGTNVPLINLSPTELTFISNVGVLLNTVGDTPVYAPALQFKTSTGASSITPPVHTVEISAPLSEVTSYTMTLPAAQGTGALTNDGSGNLSFTPNAATATALAATPTLCSTGSAPTGILANGNATGCAAIGGGSGTVTSVGFTGGLISVATPTTTPAFTVAGTSGGIPYFSGASTWASSSALTHYGVVYGGGAGSAPVSTAADTTTTHALFATATAPAFRAIASSDLPAATPTVAGTVINVADATFTTATTAIAGNTCSASAVTVAMTGVTTSMSFSITSSTDTSAITGWGSSGGLVLDVWPTAGFLNYKICNQTASSITPGAVTFNVGAR